MKNLLAVNLPQNKRIIIALTYIYGINNSRAKNICKAIGLNENIKVKNIDEAQAKKIKNEINNYVLEGNLRQEIAFNIKHLIEIHCYRGVRHTLKLPVNGQRTRHNARTRKGVRKTIANKKKATMK